MPPSEGTDASEADAASVGLSKEESDALEESDATDESGDDAVEASPPRVGGVESPPQWAVNTRAAKRSVSRTTYSSNDAPASMD
jgi:hypothetical protein